MSAFTPEDLDRLVRAHRRQKYLLLFIVAPLALVAVIALLSTGLLTGRSGAAIGLLVGSLLLLPEALVFRRYGLRRADGRALVQAVLDSRNGVDDTGRAVRATRQGWLYRGLSLASAVLLVASLMLIFNYDFGDEGTQEEPVPASPLRIVAYLVVLGSFSGVFVFLSMGRTKLDDADLYRHRTQNC